MYNIQIGKSSIEPTIHKFVLTHPGLGPLLKAALRSWGLRGGGSIFARVIFSDLFCQATFVTYVVVQDLVHNIDRHSRLHGKGSKHHRLFLGNDTCSPVGELAYIDGTREGGIARSNRCLLSLLSVNSSAPPNP